MDDWKLIHYFQDMGEAISLFKAILLAASLFKIELRRNPIEDGAISGFKGQKSVPE